MVKKGYNTIFFDDISNDNIVNSIHDENNIIFKRVLDDINQHYEFVTALSNRIFSDSLKFEIKIPIPDDIVIPYVDANTFEQFEGKGNYEDFLQEHSWNDELIYNVYFGFLTELTKKYGENVPPIYNIMLLKKFTDDHIIFTGVARLEQDELPDNIFKTIDELCEWLSIQFNKYYSHDDYNIARLDSPTFIREQFDIWKNDRNDEKQKNIVLFYIDRTDETKVEIKKAAFDENGMAV